MEQSKEGRFKKNPKTGVVRDEQTSMEWLVGPDHDVKWHEAQTWVARLGEGWRLPTRDELRTLSLAGIRYKNWGQFRNKGTWVWSGEIRDSSSAWYFDFYRNGDYWFYQDGSDDGRAFAVRPRLKLV